MSNERKFVAKLEEILQLDRADLDFGIYRILNFKRDEIVKFLRNDLLPQVKEVLAKAQGDIGTAGAEELKQAEDQARALGFTDPGEAPKVKELRAKYAVDADLGALEQEVFNHLYSFFRRYYDEGDFLSLRRYKEGVYAIPYEGEEVKLHWANADQYYIKTAEHFRDYTFKVSDRRRAHFKLVDAETERDNNKEKEKRVFVLVQNIPVTIDDGELIIRFEYRAAVLEDWEPYRRHVELEKPVRERKKPTQADLHMQATKTILASAPVEWQALLNTKPSEKDPHPTVLSKHITSYTARNTFDYFIHKDLGGFLRRELDFYIKNEVMHLDDIENETAPKVEQYLAKVRAIRRVSIKIIDFLAQLEDFQKQLWLKKKFVIDTQYLVTLDRVPRALYAEIAANESQRREWVSLFSIDEIKEDTTSPDYSEPLTVGFLESNTGLVLNTKHFPHTFCDSILRTVEHVSEAFGVLAVQSDNFQALSLLGTTYEKRMSCVHIDPPYNTQTSGFIYKNNYQHSSWLSMMHDRVALALTLLKDKADFQCHIDENEYESLVKVFDDLGIGDGGTIVWDKKNPMLGRQGIATQHEYILWRTNNTKPLYGLSANVEIILSAAERIIAAHGGVNTASRRAYSQWTAAEPGLSGGDRAYKYIDDEGFVFQSVGMGAPEPRTDEKYHIPLIHPVTRKPCPVPPNGWARSPETLADLMAVGFILFGVDETTQPRKKVRLTEESKKQVASVIQNANRGKADVDALGLEFPYCHPVSLYIELLGAAAKKPDDILIDFFAGSGTAGHAVIELNRLDGGNRQVVLVDAGAHFESVLLPRISKVIYSANWKSGKPEDRSNPSSQLVKVLRLESYEDSLANLRITPRSTAQGELVEGNDAVREDYMLRYVMNAETVGSPSLLNVQAFAHPFEYKLNAAADTVGETKEVNVDLVETFNWLLGLRVHTTDVIRGFHVITGRLPGPGNGDNGSKALVIWRDISENPNAKLDEFFNKQAYNTLDQEFDVVYVNGDNNLQNLKKDDQTWKVRLIEEEFRRLMWDVEDV